MASAGFFEQKSVSPTRFALVAGAHAAVLAAVMLAAGPDVTRIIRDPTQIFYVPPTKAPEPPPPPEPNTRRQTAAQQDPIATPPRSPGLPPIPGPFVQTGDPPGPPTGGGTVIADPPPRDPPAQPVRVDARVDPRFAAALQPEYPFTEQRAQRSGTVVIRVTIGADGRVRLAERVSASSDAFWAAAERQALNRWRFRPATLDGRPVESSKVMTIRFRIEDV